MTIKTAICIVGGGITGLTTALILKKLGFTVCIINKTGSAKELMSDGLFYAVSPASIKLLAECGLEKEISALGEDVVKMEIHSNDSTLNLDCKGTNEKILAKIVNHKKLQALLEKKVSQNDGIKKLDGFCEEITYEPKDDICRIKFRSKEKRTKNFLETKLLVIADGSNSHCRQKLQIPWGLKNYHQKAVVAKFNSRLAPCIARQWFFKDEVLALLPTSHGKVSMVWSQDERKAERLLESQGALIENGLVEILGRNIASKLELDSIPMAAPLTMISVGRYTQSRVILLGDAAHTVHPLAGLGLNMGFFDIIAFSRELESFKDLSSVSFDPGHPKVLKAYSRNRSFRIRTTQALIDTIKYSFAIDRPSVNFFRSYGVNFVNHSDFLKRKIVNFATSEF